MNALALGPARVHCVVRRHRSSRAEQLSAMKTTTPRNIDEYIAGFPPDVQASLQQLRAVVREAAPDAEEALKYRMPTFVLQENLVHFAAFENHIGLYPTPSAVEAFQTDLKDYVHAKGSVQFPLNRPVPFALVKRMVRFRVKEVREKVPEALTAPKRAVRRPGRA